MTPELNSVTLIRNSVSAILNSCGNSYINAYTEQWLCSAKALGAYHGRTIGKVQEIEQEWEDYLESHNFLDDPQKESMVEIMEHSNKLKLDIWEILIIRACKSNAFPENIVRRIQKIWRMRCLLPFNYCLDNDFLGSISESMVKLVEKTPGLSVTNVIFGMDPRNKFRFGITETDSHYIMVIKVCISLLRHTVPDDVFKNFIEPAYFRNKK